MRDIFLTNRFCLEADIYEWVRRRRWLRRRLSVRFLGRFWWDFWLPKQKRSPKGSRKRVRGKRDAFCARLKIVLCLRQQFKVLCWKCDSLSRWKDVVTLEMIEQPKWNAISKGGQQLLRPQAPCRFPCLAIDNISALKAGKLYLVSFFRSTMFAVFFSFKFTHWGSSTKSLDRKHWNVTLLVATGIKATF